MTTMHQKTATTKATPPKSLAAPGSLAFVHSIYEDLLRPNKWTTQYPAPTGPPVEDAKSAQYALIARHKLSLDPSRTLDLHSIVVQSPLLKKSLARVLDGYPGITTELDRLEFTAPFECFVHRWELLREEQARLATQNRDGLMDEALSHMQLLCSTLENELSSKLRDKNDLTTHGVTKFDQIWHLFEPGSLIYRKKDGHDRVYELKTAKFDTVNSNRVYKLECLYLDYDGTQFGLHKIIINISEFRGTKPIKKLECYPLHFHQNPQELKERLIRRGQIFESYKGYHFVSYDGIALGKGNHGEQKYNVKSRIVIDAHSFSRFNTKIALENCVVTEDDTEATENNSDNETDDDCVMLEDTAGPKQEPTPAGKRPVINKDSRFVLSEKQHLIADAQVRGFSLRDKKWFNFFIDSIQDIVWNEDAFESLVAPQDQKDLILSCAESQTKNGQSFDDFIQGKGKGIIMLLAGPPGVGKTLTAESVAEAMKVPLLSVGAADLGNKVTMLESRLSDILEKCAKWNAVLLLDEADVFMEARSATDLDRNKLVSSFLRLLEYFEGILFLTTNRLNEMDAAFESRIHLTLNYSELDKFSRRKIWERFLTRSANTKDSNVAVGSFSQVDLDKLSKSTLNGRQIKNVIKTAVLLAKRYDEGLGMSHIETVLRLRKANEKKTVSFFSE